MKFGPVRDSPFSSHGCWVQLVCDNPWRTIDVPPGESGLLVARERVTLLGVDWLLVAVEEGQVLRVGLHCINDGSLRALWCQMALVDDVAPLQLTPARVVDGGGPQGRQVATVAVHEVGWPAVQRRLGLNVALAAGPL